MSTVPAPESDRVTQRRLSSSERTTSQGLLFGLMNLEWLWQAPFEDARDHLLRVLREQLQVHDTSLWLASAEQSSVLRCRGWCDENGDKPPPHLPALAAPTHAPYLEALGLERVLVITDLRQDPRSQCLADELLKAGEVGALLDATVRREGRVAGVLCCAHLGSPRVWSDEEQQLAVGVADLLSQLLLIHELRRRDRIKNVLLELGEAFASLKTLEAVAQYALRQLCVLFPGIWAGFYQHHEHADHVRMLAFEGEQVPLHIRERITWLPLAGSLPELGLKTQRVTYVPDYRKSSLATGPAASIALAHGVQAAIAVPLIHDGRALGVVGMWLRDAIVVTEQDITALELVARIFSIAMANALHAAELRYQASHDVLTGLGNRAKLLQDLSVRAQSGRRPHRLALLRFREFRQVLHSFGREAADRLLRQLANRIEGLVGPRVRSYRLGTDEFALLYPLEGIEDLVVPDLMRRLSQPIEVGGLMLLLHPQCGVACLPEHGQEANALLHAADVALGWAESDAQLCVVYDPQRDRSTPRNLSLLGELSAALEGASIHRPHPAGSDRPSLQPQLSLHLQPKLSLRDGSITGVEALLRWQHPSYGAIAPDRAISIAEAGDLMGPVTKWVIHEALSLHARLQEAGFPLSVAVNVSAQNLGDMDFPGMLDAALARHNAPASALRLEITETTLMAEPQRSQPVIDALAERGFELDIDDFGTGYSSLAYLRRLPLKALKLDRAFVHELTVQAADQLIVRSTVGLAHGLGLAVIAEGVEDAETLSLLRDLGCDTVQGYGICRPLPIEQLIAWLQQRQAPGQAS